MFFVRRFTAVLTLALASTLGIATAQKATPPSAATTQKATPPSAATAQAAGSPKGQLVDINTATQDQLKALPGIGDAYSKRIIDGRPYTAKNQLVSRGILPQATYDKVSAMIIAKRVAAR